MWISQKLQAETNGKVTTEGTVISDGDNLIVASDTEKRNPINPQPFGIYGSIPQGENVVMCEDKVIGTMGKPQVAVNPGEVCLYSRGGAYILLKNDGSVIVNGKVLEI